MRLPRAPHRALLLCVAAAALAACSGPGSVSADRPAGTSTARGTSPSVTADARRSVVTFAGSSPLGAGDVRRTVDRMRARAEALGLGDVRVEGRAGRVTVTGRTADEQRLTELGAPGRLGFRPVLAEEAVGAAPAPQPSPSAAATHGRAVTEGLRPRAAGSASASAGPGTPGNGASDAALQARFAAMDCSARERPAAETEATARESVVACGTDGGKTATRTKFALGPTAVDGAHVTSAESVRDTQSGGRLVRLRFDSVGARQFSALTAAQAVNTPPQNQLAIVLDGVVISAPSVSGRLDGGTVDISGAFTPASADRLAATIGSGALPAPVSVTDVTRLPGT
ncbi:SecDF P1 head subdomain-containing protein [Streptomyces sp. NPDC002516]